MIPNLNALWARILIDEIAGAGIRHLCASPGSRSSPLIVAAHEHPDIEVTLHLDERSSAYFALGIARAAGGAAILCTSGTAAANFFPAVIEASQSGVPLLVLTADRPAEMRHSGATQTCDQVHLFGRYARAFRDLPLPEANVPMLRTAGAIAAHAAASTRRPLPGPVHMNIPFREPLAPVPADAEAIGALAEEYRATLRGEPRQLAIDPAAKEPPEPAIERIAGMIDRSERCLIVTGPEAVRGRAAAGKLAAVAAAARIPLLADVASGVRFGATANSPACGHADLFLKSEPFVHRNGPDLVIRFGSVPVSKTVMEYVSKGHPFLVSIQPDLERRDPEATSSWVVEAEVGRICDRLLDRVGRRPCSPAQARWFDRFTAAERASSQVLDRGPLPLEAAAMRAAVEAMPQDAALFLSNSMPIRWAEAYCPVSERETAVYVSRGVSGIDGITSTAFGVSAGSGQPLLLVTGDVAFLHDLGGLFAARHLGQPVVILLLNNDGGGIFPFLPIGEFPQLCTPLFRVPHGCRLEAAADLFAAVHVVAGDAREAGRLVADGFSERGVRVVELRTESDRMVHEHRDLLMRIHTAVRDGSQKDKD